LLPIRREAEALPGRRCYIDCMPNRIRSFTRGTVLAASVALLLAGAAHADEIYKWVDKDGKTHYSSSKDEAQGAAMTTIRPSAAPSGDAKAPPSSSSANEDIIRRPSRGTIDGVYTPPAPPAPAAQKPVARNYRSEAPADKCQLARDVLSGRAGHTNGAPTSDWDREVAQNDIRTYCGK